MHVLNLKIITPRRLALDTQITKISVPTVDGEITILPHHAHLFTLLVEGIIRFTYENNREEYLAIGGGYLETDGDNIKLLVTRAYGQDEIDQKKTEKAIEDARREMKEPKDKQQLKEVSSLLRKSLIDMKLLKKKAPKGFSND